MELLHKITAVLLCDTCKLHCIEEDLPSTAVTTPLLQAILNGFLLTSGVVLVTVINLLWCKAKELQDGFAFASTLSADMFPEEDSEPLTSCKETEGGTLLN